jgi:hypothetical protein
MSFRLGVSIIALLAASSALAKDKLTSLREISMQHAKALAAGDASKARTYVVAFVGPADSIRDREHYDLFIATTVTKPAQRFGSKKTVVEQPQIRDVDLLPRSAPTDPPALVAKLRYAFSVEGDSAPWHAEVDFVFREGTWKMINMQALWLVERQPLPKSP